MKKALVGIKKIMRITAVAVLLLPVLLIFSCGDTFAPVHEKSEMAKVSVAVMNRSGRTVLPDLTGITYELRGGSAGSGEDKVLAEFSTEGTTLFLEPGNWDFTLNAYIDGDLVLSGGISNQTIALANNTLTFYLFPLDGGQGAIHITFSFPDYAGITRIEASCADSSLLTGSFGANDFETSGEETQFIYIKDSIPAGDYFISFKFFSGNDLLQVKSELVLVRSNMTSSKEIDITAFAVTVPGGTLADKLDWLYAHVPYAQDGVEYIIEVKANENIGPHGLDYGKTVSITLIGDTAMRTINLSGTGSLFTVDSGVTLILDKNITLKGHSSNTASLVTVNTDGELVMREDSVITGNIITESAVNSYGGGVYVKGIFIMEGGKISGNTKSNGGGGGVYVGNDGTFTMIDGTISGNTAYAGAGVCSDGIFTMIDGTISGNTAGVVGGGVLMGEYGTFTKTGGTIYGYTVNDDNSNVVQYSTVAVGSGRGHAVYVEVYGGLSLSYMYRDSTAGATVALDSTVEDLAGGWEGAPNSTKLKEQLDWLNANAVSDTDYLLVFCNNGPLDSYTIECPPGETNVTITLRGDDGMRYLSLSGNGSLFTVGSGVTLILDNNITLKGHSGNNVSLVMVNAGGELVMHEGSVITGNTASHGGGVFVNTNGIFSMEAGEISGNTVAYSGDYGYGGGVYVYYNATFKKSGGTVYGYTVDVNGDVDPASNRVVKIIDGNFEVQAQRGHAAYAEGTPIKMRDSTAGTSVELNTENEGEAGGWETMNNAEIVITLGMTEWDLVQKTETVSPNTTYGFKVEGTGYTQYQWYLDGELQTDYPSDFYTFNEAPGIYEVTVVVTRNDGQKRSGSCTVTVKN
ncbi:MAG: hypothetical protein LBI04_12555 [Treponema sp.]|jgi:hypothetical protein|nr:hypothetical protein [Treponema sp.]